MVEASGTLKNQVSYVFTVSGDAVFTNDMTAQGNYGSIRTLLQNAYGFDATTVASW